MLSEQLTLLGVKTIYVEFSAHAHVKRGGSAEFTMAAIAPDSVY